MRSLNEYDFSKGSSFKGTLLLKLQSRRAGLPAEQINDDDLFYVAAAGSGGVNDSDCFQQSCEGCVYHTVNGNCRLGRKRG